MKTLYRLFLTLIIFNSATFANPYGVIGDAGVKNYYSQLTKSSLLKSGIKSLILPGDNLYITTNEYEDVWGSWLEDGFDFLVAIGNHHRSYEEEIRYFKMPGEFYVKDEGRARFIILNSDNEDNVSEQMEFLEKNLNQ